MCRLEPLCICLCVWVYVCFCVCVCVCAPLQILAAGVVHVILSAADTHRNSPTLVNSCVRTLCLCDLSDVVDAALELRSVDTFMAIAQKNVRMSEVVTNILELLMTWSTNGDLVEAMLPLLVPFVVAIVSKCVSDQAIVVTVRVRMYCVCVSIRGLCTEEVGRLCAPACEELCEYSSAWICVYTVLIFHSYFTA